MRAAAIILLTVAAIVTIEVAPSMAVDEVRPTSATTVTTDDARWSTA